MLDGLSDDQLQLELQRRSKTVAPPKHVLNDRDMLEIEGQNFSKRVLAMIKAFKGNVSALQATIKPAHRPKLARK